MRFHFFTSKLGLKSKHWMNWPTDDRFSTWVFFQLVILFYYLAVKICCIRFTKCTKSGKFVRIVRNLVRTKSSSKETSTKKLRLICFKADFSTFNSSKKFTSKYLKLLAIPANVLHLNVTSSLFWFLYFYIITLPLESKSNVIVCCDKQIFH